MSSHTLASPHTKHEQEVISSHILNSLTTEARTSPLIEWTCSKLLKEWLDQIVENPEKLQEIAPHEIEILKKEREYLVANGTLETEEVGNDTHIDQTLTSQFEAPQKKVGGITETGEAARARHAEILALRQRIALVTGKTGVRVFTGSYKNFPLGPS